MDIVAEGIKNELKIVVLSGRCEWNTVATFKTRFYHKTANRESQIHKVFEPLKTKLKKMFLKFE